MPLPLTLTPTGQQLLVPCSWADVTLAQYVALVAPDPADERTAAELLLGLDAGALNQLAADDVPLLASLLEFTQDHTALLELLPTPDLPDVGSLPYGCLLLVNQHVAALAKQERPALAALPYVLAVYRTQLAFNSTAKVEQTLQALLSAPVTEVLADGMAFLKACRTWQPGTRPTKPTSTSQRKRNWKQTLTRLFRRDFKAPSPSTPPPART